MARSAASRSAKRFERSRCGKCSGNLVPRLRSSERQPTKARRSSAVFKVAVLFFIPIEYHVSGPGSRGPEVRVTVPAHCRYSTKVRVTFSGKLRHALHPPTCPLSYQLPHCKGDTANHAFAPFRDSDRLSVCNLVSRNIHRLLQLHLGFPLSTVHAFF